MTTLPTLDDAQLSTITGGGSVDYSQQGQWISSTIAAQGQNGLLRPFNNKGLNGVRNPDMTNVVRFPGS